ncbi:hypothetical protein GCM10022224_021270 [Nonomuraea antimicrobica]|uniref:Uncharacterized protein n=1 Tax=Nonomuraea antimicrobica TaxID=561173 RepID=A0ABP7BFB2_9ACTN
MTVTPLSVSSVWNVGTDPSARGAGSTVTAWCSPSTARTCTRSPVIRVISLVSAVAVNVAGAGAGAAYAPGTVRSEAAMAVPTAITVPRLKPRSMDDLQKVR